MDSDNLSDRWVILLHTQREAKRGFSSQTRSLQFLLFMGACKKTNNKFLGPDLIFVSNLTA